MKPARRPESLLNKRVSIYAETETVDSLGEPVISETKVCDTWAAIWPKSAKEQIVSGQEMGIISHQIRIRHRSGVNHNMRIKHNTRTFKIIRQPINVGEENKWLDILATEEI